MNWTITLGGIVCAGSLPHNLITEVAGFEHSIQENFQVVTGRGVAVEVQASCRFQNPMKLQEPVCHHGQIGHHVVLAQELAKGAHHFRNPGVGLMEQPIEFLLGLFAPVPGIIEGLDLRFGGVTVRGLK